MCEAIHSLSVPLGVVAFNYLSTAPSYLSVDLCSDRMGYDEIPLQHKITNKCIFLHVN